MSDHLGISRRSVIGGIATAAAVPLLGVKAMAAPGVFLRRELEVVDGSETAPRFLHSAIGLEDGRILVTGGYLGQERPTEGVPLIPTGSVQIYEPSSGAWGEGPSLLIPRARHATVVLNDGTVAVLGGFTTQPIDSVEYFDIASNRWVFGEPLPMPVCDHTATPVNGGVVLLGGQLGARVCHVSVRSTSGRNSA